VNNVLASFTMRYCIVLVRILVAIFGGAAIAWGSVTVPIFWRQASIEDVARRIIRGEPYNNEVLMRLMPAVEAAENSTICRPIALWSAAIIRLRMVEQAGRNKGGMPIDTPPMKILDNSVRRSLGCSAAEPFLWLSLYWVESTQNKFKQEHSKYLRMSYQLGPNEGWIALKRNPVAFANYEGLPSDVATNAINEFLALINNEFYVQAVDILSGPAWRLHDAILTQLATLPHRSREAFARSAYDRGLDVKIPGIELPYSKPPGFNF
jgi:hypothetical protein